jgi:hypothetical protein
MIEDGAYFKGSIDIQKPEVSRPPAPRPQPAAAAPAPQQQALAANPGPGDAKR